MKTLTQRKTRAGTLLVGALALAACDYPAGSELDYTGGFGNATMHNLLAQSCKANAAASGGGKAGGTLADPVVVLDPASTVERPIYRVHCDGTLDGKYASIIYRDYVGSAGETQTVTAADSE
jgi:hypothetical protein